MFSLVRVYRHWYCTEVLFVLVTQKLELRKIVLKLIKNTQIFFSYEPFAAAA